MRRYLGSLTVFAVGLLLAAGCGSDYGDSTSNSTTSDSTTSLDSGLPQGSEPVTIDPADFTTDIDNVYFPLQPGYKWVYSETDDEGAERTDTVTVLDETKVVQGVTTRVVHDVVTNKNGSTEEETYDWYAQDNEGNVWYFGEDTTEYPEGEKPSTEGSWEAGVDGALAGVIMPADPEVGMKYREEYYKGHAEDFASIVSLEHSYKTSQDTYENVVVTENSSNIEPDVVEMKYYAEDVGVVNEKQTSGGSDVAVLLKFTMPSP